MVDWTYGKIRDDAEMKHLCLVPYKELTEVKKEYDRNISQETIKLIMKLGFKIAKYTVCHHAERMYAA